jgi:Arc/MetJ-type ribon-helix-helix transcriptional regulator
MGLSVRLPAQLERVVVRVAKRRGQSRSEVIRSAIVALEKEEQGPRKATTPYEAMRHLLGCASGGPPDLSEKTGDKVRALLHRRRAVR